MILFLALTFSIWRVLTGWRLFTYILRHICHPSSLLFRPTQVRIFHGPTVTIATITRCDLSVEMRSVTSYKPRSAYANISTRLC